MKIFILITNFSLLTLNLFSQQVYMEWGARYDGGMQGDQANAIAIDSAGNVYVTGVSYVPGMFTQSDICTIKYNASGVQQWVRTYSGPGTQLDEALAIALDGSGNVYVTGYIGNTPDICTIKYSTNGVQQWVGIYNGSAQSIDRGTAIAVDGAGNVYVTGNSTEIGRNSDYCTIKYNTNGVQQWLRLYDDPAHGFDGAESIAIDTVGNVYVTGGSGTTFSCCSTYCTIKYNSNGDSLWVKRYAGPINSGDIARSIAVDNAGSVYITGQSAGSGSNYADVATIKYNSSGDTLWVRRYNGSSQDIGRYLKLDRYDNVYVAGTKFGTAIDYLTIKYNTGGVQQWVATYNGVAGNDYIHSLAVDSSGNAYVTGESNRGNNGFYDYCTIKYNTNGAQQWVQLYNGPGNDNDMAYGIAVNNSGNVYVTGVSYANINGMFTIKYSPVVAITPVSTEIPSEFRLFQNYPNPFNPSTSIGFQIPGNINALLTIYDILGSEVVTLVNQQLKPGLYQLEWDASKFPSGVYYYRLLSDDYVETRKMILLK